MSQPEPSTHESRPKKAQDFAFDANWDDYFASVRGKGPRETLLHALERFDREPTPANPRLAVDVGCGEGRDTAELLRRNWRVVANDQSANGIRLLLEKVEIEHAIRLSASVADFAAATWPECDLLNSSYALPFCPPEQFPALWQKIVRSIKPGGRFSGQLFGDRDTWARCGRTLSHTREDLNRLLETFNFERLEEEEKDDLAGQTPKHWHVFHIVARKRSS